DVVDVDERRGRAARRAGPADGRAHGSADARRGALAAHAVRSLDAPSLGLLGARARTRSEARRPKVGGARGRARRPSRASGRVERRSKRGTRAKNGASGARRAPPRPPPTSPPGGPTPAASPPPPPPPPPARRC